MWHVAIDVDAPAAMQEQAAQIVNAVRMVGMFVGVEHAIEPIDIGVDELLAQIRPGIDQDARERRLDPCARQQRTAAAAVLRIVRVARAPAGAGTRTPRTSRSRGS